MKFREWVIVAVVSFVFVYAIVGSAVGAFEFIGIPPIIQVNEPSPQIHPRSGPNGGYVNITIGNATMTLRNVNGTIVIEGAKMK